MRIRGYRRLFAVIGGLIAVVAIGGAVAVSQIDPNAYRDAVARQIKAKTGRAVAIDGDMTLDFGLRPRVTMNDVRLANPSWAQDTDMLTAKHVDVDVALLPLAWGDLRLRRLTVRAPELHLRDRPDGPANWKFPDAASRTLDRGRDNLLTGFERLHVRNATITYAGAPDRTPVRLTVPALNAVPSDTEMLTVTGKARMGDTELSMEGRVGAPNLALVPDHHYPIELAVRGFGGTFRANGSIIDPLDARRLDVEVTLTSDDPASMGARLGITALDRTRNDRLQVESIVTGTDGRFAFEDLTARLGPSALSGRGVVDVAAERPRVTAKLSASTLDLRRWLAHAAPSGTDADRVFRDEALPWSLLDVGDADIELSAEMVKLTGRLSANDVTAHTTLDDGTLRLRRLDADLAGGSISATGEARSRPTPPEATLTLNGKSIAYGRLLADAGITDAIQGAAQVEASLESRGRSPRELASALSGSFAVIGDEGRIDHALVDAAGAGVSDLLAPWRETGKDVRLTCAVVRFAAANGQLDARVLLADTPTATLGGEGQIDLRAERYDLRLLPEAKEPSLASLAVPVRVTGPLRDPTIGPDPAGAAKAGAIAIGSAINPLVTIGALIVESAATEGNPCVAAVKKAKAKAKDADTDRGGDESSNAPEESGFFEDLSQSIDEALGQEATDDTNDEPVLQDRRQQRGR